jgi:hypothetical protein
LLLFLLLHLRCLFPSAIGMVDDRRVLVVSVCLRLPLPGEVLPPTLSLIALTLHSHATSEIIMSKIP